MVNNVGNGITSPARTVAILGHDAIPAGTEMPQRRLVVSPLGAARIRFAGRRCFAARIPVIARTNTYVGGRHVMALEVRVVFQTRLRDRSRPLRRVVRGPSVAR